MAIAYYFAQPLLMFLCFGSLPLLLLVVEDYYFFENGILFRQETTNNKAGKRNAYVFFVKEINKVKKKKNIFGKTVLEFYSGEYPLVELCFVEPDKFIASLRKENSMIEVL